MKHKDDNQYITRAMLREDEYVTRAILQKDEYVTRAILRKDEYVTKTMLQDVLREGEYITRTMLQNTLQEEFEKFEAKFDHKLEVMHRRIIDDITDVIHNLLDRPADAMHSVNNRVKEVETKLTRTAAVLR